MWLSLLGLISTEFNRNLVELPNRQDTHKYYSLHFLRGLHYRQCKAICPLIVCREIWLLIMAGISCKNLLRLSAVQFVHNPTGFWSVIKSTNCEDKRADAVSCCIQWCTSQGCIARWPVIETFLKWNLTPWSRLFIIRCYSLNISPLNISYKLLCVLCQPLAQPPLETWKNRCTR